MADETKRATTALLQNRLHRIIACGMTWMDMTRFNSAQPQTLATALINENKAPINAASSGPRGLLSAKNQVIGHAVQPFSINRIQYGQHTVSWNTMNQTTLYNHFLLGLGPYGHTTAGAKQPGVLTILDEICGKRISDAELGQLIFQILKQPNSFDAEALRKQNPDLSRARSTTLARQLVRISLLFAVFEAVRRRNSKGPNDSLITCEPMLFINLAALWLLANGHLRRQQLFGRDAPFGMPTGKNLATAAPSGQAVKFTRIYNKFLAHYCPNLSAEEQSARYLKTDSIRKFYNSVLSTPTTQLTPGKARYRTPSGKQGKAPRAAVLSPIRMGKGLLAQKRKTHPYNTRSNSALDCSSNIKRRRKETQTPPPDLPAPSAKGNL